LYLFINFEGRSDNNNTDDDDNGDDCNADDADKFQKIILRQLHYDLLQLL